MSINNYIEYFVGSFYRGFFSSQIFFERNTLVLKLTPILTVGNSLLAITGGGGKYDRKTFFVFFIIY